MKKTLYYILLIINISLYVTSCSSKKSDLPPGYPDKSDNINLEANFSHPPKGYGEVPFYWWIGDTLTREHLLWELEQLDKKKISSLQINYCHTDTGGIIYGRTFPSQPQLFTEEWWNLFEWFMNEAGKRGMTVSLSDYTLGAGQGSYVDEMLTENPDLNGYELHHQNFSIKRGETFSRQYSKQPLSLNAYKIEQGKPAVEQKIDLTAQIADNKILWKSPDNYLITETFAKQRIPSINPLHPMVGDAYVRHFFQKFEDRFPGKAQSGLNFFFSDELNFCLNGNIWSDNFKEEFIKRKGYDITAEIDALFMDLGDRTTKIRLDYNDVVVSLSEENFFKPLYQWHQDRGLLFGCDHGGRGKEVNEFGDYFRTQRWNQAPGCDQPYLGKDIIKNKVASSIAHLYERQRVWLEGFHSSGWGTNSHQLTDAIFANFIMGHNLLSLHGLYYTTKGGRWEWAPPCNHFHEPYWADMETLLECTERLSYILSQGYHVADVALLYPVEPVVAGYGKKAVDTAFKIGENIYKAGIDFDFMDYESLARADVANGTLNVAHESFKILIIPEMQAIRHSSLKKIQQFAQQGGIVINVGALPETTEKEGRNGKEMQTLLSDIFESGKTNVFRFDTPENISKFITQNIQRDFSILSQQTEDTPYVMHRQIAGKDLYAVYNVAHGTQCRFRTKGSIELWNPYTGDRQPQKALAVGDNYTDIVLPLEQSDIHLFVFNPKNKAEIEPKPVTPVITQTLTFENQWEFKLEPILDNTYGDYQWPGFPEKIGAYIYGANYMRMDSIGNILSTPKRQTFSYGEKFLLLNTPKTNDRNILDNLPDKTDNIKINGSSYYWQPYDFSWRWGVENDYGHQGWHGLKGEIYDNFIRLGELHREQHGTTRKANKLGLNDYYLYTCVNAPYDGTYFAEWGDFLPESFYVNGERQKPAKDICLKKGLNQLLLHYTSAGITRFVLRTGNENIVPELLNENPLRMKYRGDTSILHFDTRLSENTIAKYTFTAAPGLTSMNLTSFGYPRAKADGVDCKTECIGTRSDGAKHYHIILPEKAQNVSNIAIFIPEKWGYQGGASIDSSIKLTCENGTYEIGDWCNNDALRTYSGAAWYKNNIQINRKNKERIILDLGEIVSSAKVYVNKKLAGTRLAAPWKFDITKLIKEGTNTIEIRVCNTSANIFLSTPTAYRGDTKAGILGPVQIQFIE